MIELPSGVPSSGRRRALLLFVNGSIALIGAAGAALAGAFALRPAAGDQRSRWVRAGSLADLPPDVPVPRVLSFSRVDGWHSARARATVFLVRDGAGGVRALSATCTHLGCQVNWDADTTRFRCPCHGGVFSASGEPLEGPPPRPLASLDVRVDQADGAVLVRL